MDLGRSLLIAACALLLGAAPAARDPLPSWNDGAAKRAITAYVAKVTREGPDFVPPAERIAVFDNDGTLWSEQPIYNQIAYTLARAAEMTAKDPALRDKPAFAAIASGDRAAIAGLSEQDLLGVAAAVQAGLTVKEHESAARTWLTTARHPRFGRTYASLTYQPQIELMSYLRGAGFRVYIVSGGDVDFMRAYAENAYGVPPEQVIGTSLKSEFVLQDGRPVIRYLPTLGSFDDGPGKPVNIALHIGRAPLVAVGNSDGDQQMLEYSAASARPSLQVLVRHDDAMREYAYDRASKIGKLDKALDEAQTRGWTIVSMKSDWRTIFTPPEPEGRR